MDITLKNGRAFYQVESQLAAILIELGFATRLEKPPAPAPPTGWGIATRDLQGYDIRPMVVKLNGINGDQRFTTPPHDCPKHVEDAWKQAVARYDALNKRRS